MYEMQQSPFRVEQYTTLDAQDIRSSGTSYQQLITRQIDRINNLITIGNSNTPMGKEILSLPNLAKAAYRSMDLIESMLSYQISENYKEAVTQTRNECKKLLKKINTNEIEFFEKLCEWYALLIQELKIVGMLPEKRVDIDVDPDD